MKTTDSKTTTEKTKPTKTTYKLNELLYDLSSNDYHGTKGTFSSSQLKDMYEDEDVFIGKYITGEIPRESSDAFDVGTFLHTMVLEPEKVLKECVVFPGRIRRGQVWESFKKKHSDKTIVTKFQKDQLDGLKKAIEDSPVAAEFLVGEPEVSLFIELKIYERNIYAPNFNKILTMEGWAEFPAEQIPEGTYSIIVKVRADMLGDTFISDLKSTSGNARSPKAMKDKVKYYLYDLSAAFYLDLFKLVRPQIDEFIWIFASKEYLNCKTYRASDKLIKVGRKKYRKALIRIAECAMKDWKYVDYLDVLEPEEYEIVNLEDRDIDLI
jgi:hypothetical protein